MGSSAGAIKAGRAFVELFVEDNAAYRALDKFGARFKSWGGKLQSVGASLAAGGGAVLGGLTATLKEAAERSANLQLFADRIGGTVSSLSALQGGAERAGLSAESFQDQLQSLRVRLSEAADASGYLDDQMKDLGRAADLARLPNRQLLETIAEYVKRTPDAVRQLRALQKAGLDQKLLPYFKRGKEGVADLFKAGGPGAITEEEGRQSVALMQDLRDVWNDFKDTVRSVGLALLPTAAGMKDLKGQVTAGLQAAREWVKENRGVILTVAGLAAGAVAAGVVITGLGLTMVAVGKVILLSVALVKGAFAALFSPLGIAAVGMYLFATRTETGRKAVAGLSEHLAAVKDRAVGAFRGIAEAVGSGDWTRGFQIGLAYLKAEWANLNVYLVKGWNWTKDLFIEGWHTTIRDLKILLMELGAFFLKHTVGALRDAIDRINKFAAANPLLRKFVIQPARDAIISNEEIDAQLEARTREETDKNQAARNLRNEERRGAELDARLEASRARLGLQQLLAGGGRGSFMDSVLGSVRDAIAGLGGLDHDGGGGPARLLMGDAVKGFTGAHADVSRTLAYGDSIPAQQLDALRNINTVASANLPQMARDLNAAARGGRLTP